MFDFLFKSGGEKEQSIMEMITINASKAMISDMAIEKAVGMIAKAVAKSEFVVQRETGRVKDDVYWMLNIQTNPNETATEFWIKAIRKMFIEMECLIIHYHDALYIADNFTVDKSVTKGKKYTDITIESGGDTLKITKTFKAEEVLHLRNPNKKIKIYLKKNLDLYNSIASGLLTAKKISSVPKFALDVETSVPIIREKGADGKEKTLTIDQYKEKIKKLLESENIEVITNQSGMKTIQLQINSSITAEEVGKISKEIFTECAHAFDIPKAVFLGEITEKADSTNEFITYAVNWLVELINDSINYALVGKESYKKNEKIWIDLSKYKHVDIIESAANLDKLRAIGYNFDEIRELTGWEALGTEFSKTRALTKNYMNEMGGEQNAKETE